MNWVEVAVHTTSEGTEAVLQVLYEAGIKGVVIDDPADIEQFKSQKEDWDYIDQSLLDNKSEDVVVKGYIPDGVESPDRVQFICHRMAELSKKELGINLGSAKVELTNVKEEDWANNWKKYFKPRKVGKRIVIKPTWEPYTPLEEEIVLELDPGMAFGTGTHETTVLCIQGLEERISPHTRLLDVGCGTGILAIAGLLMGADSAIAVDIDSNAVEIAKENARRNGVSEHIKIIQGNLMDKVDGRYDIVVANIIADAIIEISDYINNYLEPKGVFIASGIILDRISDVETALESQGLHIIDKKIMGEWAAIVSRYE